MLLAWPTKILMPKNYIFIIFGLKDKFRQLINESSSKKTIIWQVSRCVIENFNSFSIVLMEYDWNLRQRFSPINKFYEPVKSQIEKINCFFLMKCIWLIKALLRKEIK